MIDKYIKAAIIGWTQSGATLEELIGLSLLSWEEIDNILKEYNDKK